jgi:hypothetical protein
LNVRSYVEEVRQIKKGLSKESRSFMFQGWFLYIKFKKTSSERPYVGFLNGIFSRGFFPHFSVLQNAIHE